jgi:diaminopimelate decarboxylase
MKKLLAKAIQGIDAVSINEVLLAKAAGYKA